VAIAMGEPFQVAADAGDDALERARVMLEERLKVLESRALYLLSSRT
jgi:hypothetical protein